MNSIVDIGKDCEDIIKDYLYQLEITDKYNKVMRELKTQFSQKFDGDYFRIDKRGYLIYYGLFWNGELIISHNNNNELIVSFSPYTVYRNFNY